MRHGLRTAKLSRPTAHRVLMLRNLVSSLLQHEQITTTLAKAKAAQKLADSVIQWGKDGGKSNWDRANAFLLNPKTTLRPLFTTLAARYESRPGGYTRIQRAGYRQGDRAPIAILELVDGRNDLRFEQAARSLGRELAIQASGRGSEDEGKEVWRRFRSEVEKDGVEGIVNGMERVGGAMGIDELTSKNVVKALRFRVAPVPVVPSESVDASSPTEIVPEADADLPAPAVPSPSSSSSAAVEAAHPSTLFLNRTYHHYLLSLASFSLSSTPTPDPSRTIKQLNSRLSSSSSEVKGAPRPVGTVPTVGRREKAGERVDGWKKSEGVEVSQKGGPISRAKGAKGRESRARGGARKEGVVRGEAFGTEGLREALP
ncbi:hypothetical protein JCM8547_004858 [Rhodosporidiobolus lusitaniae]